MQKIGDEIKSCCPFHKEVTPSFFVNLKLGIYHCFGCGVKGRIDFQEDKNKKDYNNCSLSLQNTVKKELYLPKEFKTCFWGGHLVYVPEYFKKRFITNDTIEIFGLGYNLSAEQVIIPCYHENSLLGYEYRNWKTNEKGFCIGAKTNHILYGWNYFNNKCIERIILVEGVFDFYRVFQTIKKYGLHVIGVFSIAGKHCFGKYKVDLLKTLKSKGIKQIDLFLDADCNSKDFDFIGYQLCMYFKVNNIYLYNIKKDPAECTEEEILKIINK